MLAKYQFVTDEELIDKATEIYSNIGLTLEEAIRLFLIKSIEEQGLPFGLTVKSEYKAYEAVRAAMRISEHARKIGIANMSLEEINAEIAAARKERRERQERRRRKLEKQK